MKLAIAIASLSLSIAAPVFACPEHEAPRTAEKAKPAETPETAKADKAEKAKDAKPGDKVSQR